MAARGGRKREKHNMTETTVQTIVADLIRAKANMAAAHASILERKIDGILRALMRGQVLNAGVMADDALLFVA
jgi:hypothetical protein